MTELDLMGHEWLQAHRHMFPQTPKFVFDASYPNTATIEGMETPETQDTDSTDALPESLTSSGVAQPAADVTCRVVVKSIDTPWCDDVAAGLKFFECVANRVSFVNQFKRLQAGDLFVVLRTRDACRVTAVAQVRGRQLERQSDRSLLTQHLQDGRHEALMNYLGDAKTFNAVFFDKVYDCRTLNMNLSALVARVPGLQQPRSLIGLRSLTTSRDVRDALLSFLDSCGCSVHHTRAPRVAQSRSSPQSWHTMPLAVPSDAM